MLFHKTLALVAPFTNKKGKTWYQKVFLTPDATATACDSFKMARIVTKKQVPESEFPTMTDNTPSAEVMEKPVQVDAEDLAHFTKAIKKNENIPALENFAYGDGNLIATNLESVKVLKLGRQDEEYPVEALDKLIATIHPNTVVSLSADNLKTTGDFFKKFLANDGLKKVTIEIDSEDKAVIFRAETPEHKALVLVMPIKSPDRE